jgi:hypothetical protein
VWTTAGSLTLAGRNGEPVFEDPEVTRAATPLADGEPSVA